MCSARNQKNRSVRRYEKSHSFLELKTPKQSYIIQLIFKVRKSGLNNPYEIAKHIDEELALDNLIYPIEKIRKLAANLSVGYTDR